MHITSSQLTLSSMHSVVSTSERWERLKAWFDGKSQGVNQPNVNASANQQTALARGSNIDGIADSPATKVDTSSAEVTTLANIDDLEAAMRKIAVSHLKTQIKATDDVAGRRASPDRNLDGHLQKELLILAKMFHIDVNKLVAMARAANETATGASTGGTTAAATDDSAAPAQSPETAPTQGWGVELDLHQKVVEQESTSFTAKGTVTTDDGRTIEISTELSLERQSVQVTDLHLRAGDALKDPLILTDSGAAGLKTERIPFDLNVDGTDESLPTLNLGSSYLAHDVNQNGIIDNGTELFGPTSGDGFKELAQLDSNGDGWLDAHDPSFTNLSLWRPNSKGAVLQSLTESGVGAIGLANVDSLFKLQDQAGNDLGRIARTGIYFKEDGQTGVVQHVDVVS